MRPRLMLWTLKLLTRLEARHHRRTVAYTAVHHHGPYSAVTTKAPAGKLARARVVLVVAGKQWLSGGDLVRPLAVRVEGGEGPSLLVTEPHTGIVGVGSTLSEAILDFRAALTEHRDVLEASQPPLSADLADQLARLRRHLRGTNG